MTTLSKLNLIMSIANDVSTTLDVELTNCNAKEVEERIRATFREMAKKRYLDTLLKKNMLLPPTPVSKTVASVKGIRIYCDGGCNDTGAGTGVVVFINDKKPIKYYGGFNPLGTNNTAELTGIKIAILKAIELWKDGDSTVQIMSDSRYAIDSVTNWAYSWKRHGWRGRKGAIKNIELIREIHEIYHKNKSILKISWVKGHSNILGNELADEMATLAMRERQVEFIRSNK